MTRCDAELERLMLASVTWRLISFSALLYVLSIPAPVNDSVALLTMNLELGFAYEIYGLGAASAELRPGEPAAHQKASRRRYHSRSRSRRP